MADHTEVAAAHPIKHGKNMIGGNAEIARGLHFAGDGHEMAGDVGLAQALIAEPFARGMGVEQGFGGAERFAGNAEHGGFGFQAGEHFGDIGVIGVGHEMHAHLFAVGVQRLGGDLRPKSEPPMPMCTKSVMRSPVAPVWLR